MKCFAIVKRRSFTPFSGRLLLLIAQICALSPASGQDRARELSPSSNVRVQLDERITPFSTLPNSVAELRSAIQKILRGPELTSAIYGVKIASLDTGQVIFEENAAKLLRPASNLKLYTWAAALVKLSPDYRFRTSVYAVAPPDTAGNINGNLTVYGRGDPSFGSRFYDGDPNKAVDLLASAIARAGVKKVDGDLVGDETYFTGPRFASGWEWEDLQWSYGAEISALTVNDNSVELSIRPGAAVGDPCVVSLIPSTQLITVVNRSRTSRQTSRNAITVFREAGRNVLDVGGSMPIGGEGYSGTIAVSHPAIEFVDMLKAALARAGVTVSGRARVIERTEPTQPSVQPSPQLEIANVQSPALSVIAAETLKRSQNLYSELVLRTLGKSAGVSAGVTDDEAGTNAVKAFLTEAGIDTTSLTITDGSGLSRNDLVTANSTVQLLAYMSRNRDSKTFYDALPIGGVDGTLKNRMKRTAAAGNVHAKTGTLASAVSLSGYVTSARGERIVFSIIINNFPDKSQGEIQANVIDPIAVLLASFSGHT